MLKEERQAAIREIISEIPTRRQEEIVTVLRGKGYDVTQASVSRDLIELGIKKVKGIYSLPTVDRGRSQFGQLSFHPAGSNLLVVKCVPGYASAAASEIDNADIAGVAGTIAGDDTIFVAVSEDSAQNKVIKELIGLFNG